MTSWGTIAISAAAMEGALEKIKMLRPRRLHKHIEATIRVRNQ
jgi:hypothetical protein